MKNFILFKDKYIRKNAINAICKFIGSPDTKGKYSFYIALTVTGYPNIEYSQVYEDEKERDKTFEEISKEIDHY